MNAASTRSRPLTLTLVSPAALLIQPNAFSMRNFFWLSDDQWQRIDPLLPTDVRGKDRVDDRRVISSILHVLTSGCR
jgi:hypothetical protein